MSMVLSAIASAGVRRAVALAGLTAILALPPAVVHAQPAVDPFAANGKPSDWNVVLGAGVALRPTFEGSDRYFFTPVPFLSVVYKDMVSFDTSGLNAYWRSGGLQIGGGATYSLGRLQNSNSVFSQGDERLRGLGDVPAAIGLRAFANYSIGPVTLGTTFTKFLADGNDGILINLSAAMPFKVGDRTTITARLFGTWADQSYMQTYFGITPGQSFNTSYAIYSPGSGVKDFGLNLGVKHEFGRSWLLSADARLARYGGIVENSPLAFSDFNMSFLAMIGYRF